MNGPNYHPNGWLTSPYHAENHYHYYYQDTARLEKIEKLLTDILDRLSSLEKPKKGK